MPGVFLTQRCFRSGWFVLSVFSAPSGTRDKRIFYQKKKKVVSKCVRSRAACCVFFTTASPEEGLKASPFKMFQLILESDLNKIAPLTTATVLAGLVIICLSGVSGARTSHRFSHVPRRGGEIALVRFFYLLSSGAWGNVHPRECGPARQSTVWFPLNLFAFSPPMTEQLLCAGTM